MNNLKVFLFCIFCLAAGFCIGYILGVETAVRSMVHEATKYVSIDEDSLRLAVEAFINSGYVA